MCQPSLCGRRLLRVSVRVQSLQQCVPVLAFVDGPGEHPPRRSTSKPLTKILPPALPSSILRTLNLAATYTLPFRFCQPTQDAVGIENCCISLRLNLFNAR